MTTAVFARALLPTILLSASAAAQGAAPAPAGDAAITGAGIRRHVEALAHDSMLGRDTPSRGLERAAAYVVAELERLGLRPAGDGGTYEQRWGVSRWVPDTARSRLRLSAGGLEVGPRPGAAVRWVAGSADGRGIEGEALLLPAALGADAAEDPRLAGRVVLLPVDYTRPIGSGLQDRVDRLARRAAAVLVLSNRDSATFARRLADAARPRLAPDFRAADEGAPVLEVLEDGIAAVLEAAGLGPARLRDPARARAVPSGVRVSLRLERRYVERARVPNLVAVLEGADPALRDEYVVVSAHLDGVGIRPGAPDSINNGADDNASGVAGLLEIAEAMAGRERRPRRSVLFLVPSGEERGLWGSDYFVRHPVVALDRMVANLNMDLIGRNWPDSVIVVGPEFSTLGETLHRVVAERPELGMGPVADRWPEERIFYRSDHYHFARGGVPILFFTSGTHPDYHQPTDTADLVDADKAARVARLVHRVAAAVADDPERPRWSPESYRTIVRGESP